MSPSPQPQPQPQPQDEDPFDSLLNLESNFYEEGYSQGMADGVQAGRTEGRQLGLEKGYQKFFEAGRLYGRAIVWANRLPSSSSSQPASTSLPEQSQVKELSRLPANARLHKNITTLYALVETESLSTENTDEAVNDFDDRLKRGQGKAKMIERAVGEKSGDGEKTESGSKGVTV
ncbi:hypothetical protein QBC35DRAFT_487445 [Podospora australis]|uniref:Essential protein Yae1 N-terminal domain-containing protein n=1 Tax=Podospora australis TaxID=1536484 RepID=A0AAN6WZZ9_9PEZI|nr:hypothetical protein QBC35DRAFT_487445 [Podospora australis]